MKGPGGLQLGEFGQSIAQGTKQAITDSAKKNLKAVGSQLGVTTKQQGSSQGLQQPRIPDAFEDFGDLLEQNQVQQQMPGGSIPQQPRQNIEEKYAGQHQQDQSALDAARKNLQKIEDEMKSIKEEREKNWAESHQQEQQEKKMEELQIEERQKQQPVRAGSPNPEGGKKKG